MGLAKKLPLAADMQICDAPTLLWSTDGARVYAAFFYKANDAQRRMLSGGAAVSFSRDSGLTWSARGATACASRRTTHQ
jgi:hypothetical protein